MSGSVGAVLALRLTTPAAHLGSFVPGIARAYETTMAAEVTSSAGNAALSVSDADGSGRLANGPLRLAEPLQVKAQGQQAEGGAFAPLTADPVVLLRYAGPVGLDPVTITLRQSIGATEPLRTGDTARR